MDFIINTEELTALYGLSHMQQLVYLRGIRPFMDHKTRITGAKRRISYQSISEQLYVEPHPGIAEFTPSRQQLRRAIKGLERAGLIKIQSIETQLILKCLLASQPYSVQNKADTNPTQQPDMCRLSKKPDTAQNIEDLLQKADTGDIPKADTPLNNNNYIYLLSAFEQFWNLYPEKKSKQSALDAFQNLNPDEVLVRKLLTALKAQIEHRKHLQANGAWVPPWKYPATWLTKRSWEDELSVAFVTENSHASNRKSTFNQKPSRELFWVPDDEESEFKGNNVLEFKRYKSAK